MDALPSDSWKITLPCNKAEADAIGGDAELVVDLATPPVLMVREPDPDAPERWLIEAYVEQEPDTALLAAVRALAPSSGDLEPQVEHIPAQDWVTLSQAGLEPVQAGRFFVCTPAHANRIPRDTISFVIEAGLAFGTGQHETTTACMLMLDRMKRLGMRFDNVADIGTGTGLLAFAAQRLWPRAAVIASDIDPIAVEVALENAEANGFSTGIARGAIEMVTAPGLEHPRLRRRAPYDLLIANILAGPLIELAPGFSDAVAPGGSLILAGLLDTQADAVAEAYRRHGMRLDDRIDRGDWPTLRLTRSRVR